ncbi:hypothetical protein D3C72_1457510 [compost metagenome]
MPRLDRHQPAEPAPQYEHRPQPQHAATGKQRHAQPAHRVAIDRPELDAVGIGRQISRQQTEHAERGQHPAVAAVFAHAAADIAAGEQRGDGQGKQHQGQRHACRVGEEGADAAPARDSDGEVGECAGEGGDCQAESRTHSYLRCDDGCTCEA